MTTHKLSDPEFIDNIIFEVKSQGHFDAFRRECLADVDTQPAYQNLHSRVESTVQKFLNRQVWTPEIKNKNRLREEMRTNIIRAGFLDSGVSRIVDQVVEQKIDYIQSKVEDILYKYVGMEKPKKEDKQNGSLEIDTTLLPTDLEQVSPDSDKKSSDSLDIKEEIEEEIVEDDDDDDDFESPAFEPIEPIKIEKNQIENNHNSNLSEISGLTSDSNENKSHKSDPIIDDKGEKPDTALSQISSTQDNMPDITETTGVTAITVSGISGEEAQMAFTSSLTDSTENENEVKQEELVPVCQFDLKKDAIEFTGTERKSITLDDSTNSGESEKVIQVQSVQSMEVDNLYENDTTDSSMRMEIDLKDETTQETGNLSKMEESSQDSSKIKDKRRDNSKDQSKSSNKSSKSHHHSSSSSSKSKHDDRSRHKTSSSSHKKSSYDKDRSSSGRRDRDKDRKPSESSKSSRQEKQEEKKSNDDHYQEKSSRRRKSSDHDSNGSKDNVNHKTNNSIALPEVQRSVEEKSVNEESMNNETQQEKTTENKSNENFDVSPKISPPMVINSKQKEQKSSILVKYDYLKTKSNPVKVINDEDDQFQFHGFALADDFRNILWFECMQRLKSKQYPTVSNNNHVSKKQDGTVSKKLKMKGKNTDSLDSPLNQNGTEELTAQQKSQIIAQQQRYNANDLYKPKFDFRSRRRAHIDDTF